MSEESSTPTPEAEPSAVPEGEVAKKPRRRRRTKAEVEAARAAEAAANATGDSVTESAAEAPARPKRARTRKAAAKPEAGEGGSGVPESAPVEKDARAAAAPEAAADGEAPVKKPRRRTARQRMAAETAVEGAGDEVRQEVPLAKEAGEAEAVEVPRKRRGRPRKKATEGEQAPAAQADGAAEAAQARPVESAAVEKEQAAASTGEKGAEPAASGSQRAEAPGATSADASSDEAPKGETGEGEFGRGRRRSRRFKDRDGEGPKDRGGDRGHGDREGRGDRNDRFDRNNRRGRNNRRNQQNVVAEPSLTRETLAEMKVAELRSKAAELGVEYVGVRKPELVEAVYAAAAAAEGFRPVEGILEIGNEGYGWIRTGNYMEGDGDAFVHQQMIRNLGLRPGDRVAGTVGPGRNNSKYPPLQSVATVNGRPTEGLKARPRFRDLTPIFPNERLAMEHGRDSVTGRAIDLVAPIGKGQRGLIVSPPKAGKTTVLKKICQSIAANNPEVHLFCLLVDERPEEVTDMERSIRGEVVASTFDMPADNHTHVSELVIEHAKRLVELGEDVVVVLDSITRLARAYNLAQPASGRILSGGVDSAALYPPKKFLGAARNIEGGGSLTIIASALVDTGSKMDEVIFEEFKGTGNMELKLDRDLADRRIFPAIDPISSGTRNEDLLIDPMYQPLVWGIRRVLANMNNTERAANALVKGLKGTETNEEFLIRSAKKAQQSEYVS